ncbi:MAG: iron-containing alcohol dehydrogenase [Eubacteriales bacterium]|nr:iron-containing alcohol dehydrogenase [Eubacteriales bacterium]
MSFRMYVPTRIIFGAGSLNKLSRQKMPGKKALVVISNGKSTKANGYLDRTLQALEQSGVETIVFDKIMANPLKSTIMEGGAFAKANGCDCIVALGGGSVIDAAKAISIMATNDGDLWDYVYGGTGKGQRIAANPLPIIAITTTAGTGSEVDAFSVISNEETNEKIGLGGDPRLFPKTAIVDPELMTSVPPRFTAYQGFDALFHSVECYISKSANLMSDMYALTAIENIGQYLARAVVNGSDLEAREHVAFANTLSGVVMTMCSLTSEHAIEHAMSAYHQDLPHGAGLLLISIPYFTHFVNQHVCDDRFIRMAQALGNADAADPMDFVTALAELKKACGVDDLNMSDFGIQKEEAAMLAQNARETMGALFKADRAPLSDEACAAIIEKAF